MKTRSLFSLLAVFFLAINVALAADWPQWRGPNRNGISDETDLLKAWPEGGPKLVWQIKELGDGYATPSVVGSRIYVLGNKGLDNEFIQALEVKDGAQVWSTPLGKVGNPNQRPSYPAARSTPTVDGERIYALSSDGDLACLETSSGKIVWRKNLRSDFNGEPGVWAYSESPLVDGNVLVCTPGGADATMVALDKTSGDVIWKAASPQADQAGYASVIVVDVGGVKQYVQFMQKGLVGVDAKTGKFLWRYERTAQGSPANIPTPVAHDGFVYSAAGKSGGAVVQLKVNQGTVEADPAYFTPKLPSSIGGSVFISGNLYGTNSQGLMCIDFAKGDIKWQERGIGAGALLYADQRLYLHGEKGDVALVEATPEAYHEKGRFTPPNQPDRGKSQAWAYPVVANGRLYIRDTGSLWSYDIQDSGK